jgi:hypothetical protein
MLKQGNDFLRDRERALADCLSEVAAELRLIEPADFVAFIRTEQFANIRTLVNSSTEMFFKPGTIRFGASADVYLGWGRPPSVMLDMEFHHRKIDVYFRLLLESLSAGVEINYISFGTGSNDPDENTRQLRFAVEDARIPVGRRDVLEDVLCDPPGL